MSTPINPFIQNTKLKVVKLLTTGQELIIDVPGVSKSSVSNIAWAEQQSHVNMYRLPYMDNILFKECNSVGRDLFLFISVHLKQSEDFITLRFSRVSKAMGISTTKTFYKAIRNLIDVGVICRKGENEYWVNPMFLFKGDRIKHYRDTKPENIEVVSIFTL